MMAEITGLEAHIEEHGLLSQSETETAIATVKDAFSGQGSLTVLLGAFWNSDLRWARNRPTLASDRRDIRIEISLDVRGGKAGVTTNQLDKVSLQSGVRAAEKLALLNASKRPYDSPQPSQEFPTLNSATWSDKTVSRSIEDTAKVVKDIIAPSKIEKLQAAGYIDMFAMSIGSLHIDPNGKESYSYRAMTQAQCTATVRHPHGIGSGWAGSARYDLQMVDEIAIAGRALDKCLQSIDPVRIEPGRYTAVLEPQAVSDLIGPIVDNGVEFAASRTSSESMTPNPYIKELDRNVNRIRSKAGQKVVDERITISHDPTDPEVGSIAVPGLEPVTWIDRGVLKNLSYDFNYAARELLEVKANIRRGSIRMAGGNTTVEDMIGSTKRGLLVSRLSKMRVLDKASLLSTGMTRDGLWLIENGKITKAVRNFRVTESPLFALNNLVDLGIATAVYQPFTLPKLGHMFPTFALTQVIVPTIKVNDFSFTSTIDAI